MVEERASLRIRIAIKRFRAMRGIPHRDDALRDVRKVEVIGTIAQPPLVARDKWPNDTNYEQTYFIM